MPNNFYQQYLDAQKAMFEEWRKYMKSASAKGTVAAEDGLSFNPSDAYERMVDTQQEFWRKAGESYKSYYAVFELWKKLSENNAPMDSKGASQIYDEWTKQYFGLIRSNFAPNLPGYIKGFTEKLVDNMEASSSSLGDFMQTWGANEESMRQAFQNAMANGPKGYVDFLEVWQQSYDDTFGKLMNAPTFGKDMDFWKQQKSSFDRFIKYNIAATKFYTSLFEIAQDATKQVLEDYVTMAGEGNQPKTFDEFYKYWSKMVTASYEKVLFSENLSKLAGNMVDEMSKFKLAYDKLCEFYLANVPVPKQSEINDLYKSVYELKKELRSLKKEIQSNEKNSK